MDYFYNWLRDVKQKNPKKFESIDIEARIGYMVAFLIENNNYAGLHIELPLTIEKVYNSLKNRIDELR